MMFGFKRCNHKWKIMSETTMPSTHDNLIANGFHTNEISAYDTQKKLVIILACTECGKLDKTVEVN